MKSALAGTLERARSTFSTISLGQKVVIGLLLVGLLLGGFFFFRWITAPTQAPLFSNLAVDRRLGDRRRAQRRAASPTRSPTAGRRSWSPRTRSTTCACTMSGKGLPAGQDTGYALLDQQGITTSEFQQQVTYQRALEGELSKTLEALKGVNAGRRARRAAQGRGLRDRPGQADRVGAARPRAGHHSSPASRSRRSPTWSPPASRAWTPTRSRSPTPPATCCRRAGTGITAGAGDARSQVEQEYEARLAANAQQILDTRRRPGPRQGVGARRRRPVQAAVDVGDLHLHATARPPLSSSTHDREVHAAPAPRSAASSARRTCPTRRPRRRRRLHLRQDVDDGQQRRGQDDETVDGRAGRAQPAHRVGGDGQRRRRQPQPERRSSPSSATPSAWTPPAATRSPSPRCRSTPPPPKQAAADLAAAKAAESSAQMWSMIKTGGIAAGIALVVLLVWLRSRRQRGDRGGVRAARAHRRHARRARPAADRQHPRGAGPRSTTVPWSSRPPSGRRSEGRSPPWSASVPTRSPRCSAAG